MSKYHRKYEEKGKYITLALENKMDLCYKALDRVLTHYIYKYCDKTK